MLTVVDWVVVALYFALTVGVAMGVGWLEGRKGPAASQTTDDYFLAGRNTGWLLVGSSLFASNIGSEHLVGLAGSGAAGGIAVAQFEILACLMLLLLGWLFVPFYLRTTVTTMPELLERRFGAAARWYLASISIVAYVLTKISVTIFAGAVVFQSLMGIDFWTGAVLVVLITGAYTVIGGLKAVLWTDFAQLIVLLGGAAMLTVYGVIAVGGPAALARELPPGFLSLWRPMDDPELPWTGVVFGAPILGIWYWCTDQFIVQRTLAARGVTDARRGALFGGWLKLLPLFVFVVPGLAAHVLAKQGKLILPSPDQALPRMVLTLLPEGARGVVVAGLLAALMSSLSSVFNSCSTLITWDVYRKLRPDASQRTLVLVGQGTTVVMVVLGLAWIPLMSRISPQLYSYLQAVQAYISPPIAAVFLLGISNRRINNAGALTGLLGGGALGLARFGLELGKGSLSGPLRALADLHFLHFAALLFLLSGALTWGVSLLTAPPPASAVALLDVDESGGRLEEPRSARRLDMVLSAGLVLAVGVLWVVFR